MCGIVGAIDLQGNRLFPTSILQQMLAAIHHRGPDDEHWHIEPGIALGTRRLAIVDLQGGRQPLSNETEDIWASFNGELFEFPELHAELRSRGHQLASRCDTEIWVHLYEDVQERVFERVKGQFAAAIWDRRRQQLLLGRDRFGIVPLFYTVCDGWLLWASEVKGLLASGLMTARPNLHAFDHFLTFTFSGGLRQSFFEGVKLVAPGTYLQIRGGHVSERTYWDLNFPAAGQERRTERMDELADELDERLQQAVRRRLRGDVLVVSYLSGGVDSTLVTALATKIAGAPIPAYTIGLDRAGKDERGEAQRSADLLGVPLTVVNMRREDMADAYPELIHAAEAPVVDTTAACMIRLAQRVHADGFKVTLSGEGADELWAGYPWYRSLTWRYPLARLLWLRGRRKWKLRSRSQSGDWIEKFPSQIGPADPVQTNLFCWLSRLREELYSAETWERLRGHTPLSDLDGFWPKMQAWHPLHQSSYLDFRLFLHGHLLSSKGDRPAMHASLETRPPFLDEDVVEFGSQLAPRYKFDGRIEKRLLREVANRYLPRDIAFRPKHGFRGTFSGTFLGPNRPAWVDQLLSPESLQAAGYFRADNIAKMRQRLTTGRGRVPLFDFALTAAVSIQLWHHKFCGGGLCDLPTWSLPMLAWAAK